MTTMGVVKVAAILLLDLFKWGRVEAMKSSLSMLQGQATPPWRNW